jgi:hypothetical protein
MNIRFELWWKEQYNNSMCKPTAKLAWDHQEVLLTGLETDNISLSRRVMERDSKIAADFKTIEELNSQNLTLRKNIERIERIIEKVEQIKQTLKAETNQEKA